MVYFPSLRIVDLIVEKALPKLLIKQTTSIFIQEHILGIGKKKNQCTSILNAIILQYDYNSYY